MLSSLSDRRRRRRASEPVLVVGDSAEAFRINHTETKRRGLVLSSQMLKLAREVK